MRQWLRSHLTYANVMVTILAFVVLGGGTALASYVISSNSQVARNTISGHKPPKGSHSNIIGGSVNATDLASPFRASLRLHCPSDMRQAAGLCFEDSLRSTATLRGALAACALAQRRLPTLAELALVFNNGPAVQHEQWIATQYFDANGADVLSYGGTLEQDSSRTLSLEQEPASSAYPFRCVTSPTN